MIHARASAASRPSEPACERVGGKALFIGSICRSTCVAVIPSGFGNPEGLLCGHHLPKITLRCTPVEIKRLDTPASSPLAARSLSSPLHLGLSCSFFIPSYYGEHLLRVLCRACYVRQWHAMSCNAALVRSASLLSSPSSSLTRVILVMRVILVLPALVPPPS